MTKQAVQIANTFLTRGRERGVVLDATQLMKLVYCAQGWYLAIRDESLIADENVEAWQFGPVFPSLYRAFKQYSSRAARPTAAGATDDADIVALVDHLLSFHEQQTVLIPHLMFLPDSPWDIVWNQQNGRRMRERLIIPNQLIRAHFAQNLVREVQTA